MTRPLTLPDGPLSLGKFMADDGLRISLTCLRRNHLRHHRCWVHRVRLRSL
jgi:hypothetical protein